MRHEVSVTIDAPAELVWRTLEAVEQWPEWTPTMSSVRRKDEGEFRVGSEVEVKQPRLTPAVWTVTELEPGRSFNWRTKGAGFRSTAEHQVMTGESGAVTVKLAFEISGPLSWPIAKFAGGLVRKYVDTEAESLKRWCEEHA
ncbi:SRPBCC family protein [Amycolatopsis nigrescens]|uniref:SRPBCC family protein n=1 Tax=Amycolatopsis nigrescens TaxID=381445 RepID=UPI000379E311|nr:SRPBCC family protein [Amycolatopsis nigrescens]